MIFPKFFCVSIALLISSASLLTAGEQVIRLESGWNAVYLEIAPEVKDPALLFSGLPIQMCATWIPSKGKVVNLTDVSEVPTKTSDWSVWQPSTSSTAFLNTLRGIKGRQSYLIKVSDDCQLTVQGDDFHERKAWIGSSFNFVGFDVDPAAPPTFARFFDGSRAHEDLKVFTLVNNRWQQVAASETIQRGVAYWVWTKEGSDFQGPLDVSFANASEGLIFSAEFTQSSIQFSSNGSLPVIASISKSGGGAFSYSVDRAAFTSLPSDLSLPLSDGARANLRLSVEGAAPATGTLTISGAGMLYKVPFQIQ